MAWIESHTVLARHRKVMLLADSLHVEIPQILGHLHILWHAVLEQQEDGDLAQWSDSVIAHMAMWKGDGSEFVTRLREFGWLDGSLIHDWIDYTGPYLTKKYSSGNVMRLKEIWAKHGYKYGKGQGKYAKQKASGKRAESERKVRIPFPSFPNPSFPNPSEPNQEEKKETTMSSSPKPELDDVALSEVSPKRNYRTEAKEVLDFLNAKTGRQYRPVESTLTLIAARLRGQSRQTEVDVQTCKSLIARKARDWLPDEKMQKYLRPETLFNRTKFESYLGELTCIVPNASDSLPKMPLDARVGGGHLRSL